MDKKKTIKMCTDLPQSKKLAEILPLESADMIWVLANPDLPMIKAIAYEDSEKSKYYEILPAWSLVALLNVIPKHTGKFNVLRIDIGNDDFSIWYEEIGFGVSNELPDITMVSAVDACVEMIVNLYEQELL